MADTNGKEEDVSNHDLFDNDNDDVFKLTFQSGMRTTRTILGSMRPNRRKKQPQRYLKKLPKKSQNLHLKRIPRKRK